MLEYDNEEVWQIIIKSIKDNIEIIEQCDLQMIYEQRENDEKREMVISKLKRANEFWGKRMLNEAYSIYKEIKKYLPPKELRRYDYLERKQKNNAK